MVHIVNAVSGFPAHYYRQEEITTAMRRLWSSRSSGLERLERFHNNMLVNGRYLALPLESYLTPSGFGERNDAWIEAAMELGEDVLCRLLDRAQLAPQEIDQITFTTITGIAVPSVDARLMNRIPFSRHMKRVPLFGLGCVGGAAGIARLADYLAGHPDQAAILLSIELCSLTIQHQDLSVENMISTGLFGDGAAAVLMVGERHPLASAGQPRVVDNRSVFFPHTEHIMGWVVNDTGFKIVLSAEVSAMVEANLKPALIEFLAGHRLEAEQISHWLVHPGGPKVIQSVEAGLGLKEGALELSREILAGVGNVSSASVLMILERALARYRPEPGSYGVLMAMGPAFGAELVLLQW